MSDEMEIRFKHLQPEQYKSWLKKATDPEWDEEKFGCSTRSKAERAAASFALELYELIERISRLTERVGELERDLHWRDETITTHWDSCGEDPHPKHHACSLRLIAALKAKNERLEEPVSEDEKALWNRLSILRTSPFERVDAIIAARAKEPKP